MFPDKFWIQNLFHSVLSRSVFGTAVTTVFEKCQNTKTVRLNYVISYAALQQYIVIVYHILGLIYCNHYAD